MSRAEYYREYRKRQKSVASSDPDSLLEVLRTVAQHQKETTELLQHVAQQLAQLNQRVDAIASELSSNDLQCSCQVSVAQQSQQIRNNVAQQDASEPSVQHVAQHVSQQIATLSDANKSLKIQEDTATESEDVAQHVAEIVAQQRPEKKPKRKGFLPPSSPPSHPPHTPPYSSPLLSPHFPKEKAPVDFSLASGSVSQTATSPDENPADVEDNPLAPLVDPGRTKNRDLATWADLESATDLLWAETQSHRLREAFYDWIEYKRERGPKDFYTRKGMIAEAKRFIKRHLDGADVTAAVNRAVASSWQGWDHDLAK